MSARGQVRAPRVSLWGPIVAKLALAIFAAVVLAFIGMKAGAHSEPPAPEETRVAPAGVTSAHPSSSPTPAMAEPSVEGAPAHVAGAPDAGGESAPGLLPDGRVVLNVASADELTKLPGIGPSRAKAILALRQRLAKFRAVEDLLRVKGIGRKTLKRLKPNLVLDRPAVPDGGAAVERAARDGPEHPV